MCNHENIVVTNYLRHIGRCGKWHEIIACRVRCDECETILCDSDGEKHDVVFEYIEKNKKKFKTLFCMVNEDLNEKYGIEDGFHFEKYKKSM